MFSLVHFERFPTPLAAIEREKELKRLGRRKKVVLVSAANPEWRELAPDVPPGWRGGGRRGRRDFDVGER